jgi:hypothetical protein
VERFQLSHEVGHLDHHRTTININNKITTLQLWTSVAKITTMAEKRRRFFLPPRHFIEQLAATDLGDGCGSSHLDNEA